MATDTALTPSYAWVVSAYDRDWEHLGLVEALLEAAVALGLVGRVGILTVGDKNRPESLRTHNPAEAPALVSEALWHQPGPKQVTAEGESPAAWQLGVTWFRDDPTEGTGSGIDAIGRLTLRFGTQRVGDPAFDESLWLAFCRLHDGSNTTCAWIDAWDRWLDLRDAGPPLISRGTFESVFWANFVDAPSMSRFRRDALDLSGAAQVDWDADGALYLRLTAELALRPGATDRAHLEALRARLIHAFCAASG